MQDSDDSQPLIKLSMQEYTIKNLIAMVCFSKTEEDHFL